MYYVNQICNFAKEYLLYKHNKDGTQSHISSNISLTVDGRFRSVELGIVSFS